MIRNMVPKYHWPGIYNDVKEFVRSCETCQKSNARPMHKYVGKMVLFAADHFNQQVAVDIVGPMPVTITGNRYMITIMDRFSRYLKIIPVPDVAE